LTAELSDADRAQLAARGIEPDEAERQLRLLRDPPPPLRLVRPCTVGDGIRRFETAEREALRVAFQRAVGTGAAAKLVPASGAATRMFRSLLALLEEEPFPATAELSRRAATGDASARDLERLWRELPRFPFFDELAAVCAARGASLPELLERRDGRRLLGRLLTDAGLGLAALPKGLIPFHRYPAGSRTAAEEHLWEGSYYLADAEGVARHHFTVAAEAHDRFATELADAADRLLRARGVVAEVGLSVQDPATDTLAVTPEGEPFRDGDGTLLLRPGGHGALLGNLAALPSRWLFVKNVDNVRPEDAHERVAHWPEVLGGLLVTLEERAHELVRRLRAGGESGETELAAGERFVAEELGSRILPRSERLPPAERRRLLLDRLDRPLRVCGVVENRGEPGGGPFWVRREDGEVTAQIVEGAQLGDDAGQQALFGDATHFNPVQIAVALRDAGGAPFDLARYVDDQAVFIAAKSHAGRPLLALERPGLWNGAMAGWNTVFVEVPAATFAPVKTLFDLLRPEHQPLASNAAATGRPR
jgi:hypothetical protein